MSDDAASNPLSFVVAGSLIIGIIGVALVTTGNVGSGPHASSSVEANRGEQAAGLLGLIVDTPGSVGASVWDGAPSDAVVRLGLRDPDQPYLDIDKFRNLKLALLEADATDGRVNYMEAKQMFGLEAAGIDFHLRAYPTLQSVQDQLAAGIKDPNLKVAYIGNVEDGKGKDEPGGPEILSVACSVSPLSGSTSRYEVEIRNTGQSTTQFYVALTIDNDDKAESVKDQSPVMAPGDEAVVPLDVPSTPEAGCFSDSAIEVTLIDITGTVAGQEFNPPSPVVAAAPQAEPFAIELGEMHYVGNEEVTVYYYDADKNDVLHWELQDASGAVVSGHSGTHTVPNQGDSFVFDAPVVPGDYRVVVRHQQHDAYTSQRVVVLTHAGQVSEFVPQAGLSPWVWDEAAGIEMAFLHRLVEQFCPSHYDSQTSSELDGWDQASWNTECQPWKEDAGSCGPALLIHCGDVYPDDATVIDNEFCARLIVGGDCKGAVPRFDETTVIVVGSNVEQQNLNHGHFKKALETWVTGGGTLIVFGSPDATTNWLNAHFKVSQNTGNDPLGTPDPSHPLLVTPNTLDYGAYDFNEETWQYTGQAASHFSNIVNAGEDNPVTAISNPGDLYEGTLLISTWLPYDVFGTGSCDQTNIDSNPECREGMRMLENFVTQAYRDLFLDYGPPIPPGVERASEQRQTQIMHDQLGLLDIRIQIYVFSG